MKKSNGHKLSGYLVSAAVAAATAAMAMPVQAYNLYSQDGTEVNLDVEAVFGMFSSDENYFGKPGNGSNWQEGYLKAGFSGSKEISGNNSLYGGLNFVSSGTWGDGDAGGNTNGSERRTAVEDAFVGFRSDMFDFSFGRQNFTIGDGFVINGDALNLGEGVFPGSDRGGAYWLAWVAT